MSGVTRQERRRREATFTKCWCGNTAGVGETLCGKHRDEHDLGQSKDAQIAALEAQCDALAGALEPFAKSGELLVNAGDSGKFWAYRPAGGDEYAITGGHLIAAHTTLAQHKGDA